MAAVPAIAILDIGKTNKKFLLFDESYNLVHERSKENVEITDEDGFPCEDIKAITGWIRRSLVEFPDGKKFKIKAINISAHGAGLVHLDARSNVLMPLYNYLKPYPELLRKRFYDTYGDEVSISKTTASPALGNLNAGLQLYRIKHERPYDFEKIRYSLHLPQYLSHLFTQEAFSDITSIGCHTCLWDFEKHDYHPWVHQEGIYLKLAPITSTDTAITIERNGYPVVVGIGLHDSSAALIPYLKQFDESFVLLSTGTWNITLNPYNKAPLSEDELEKDCLCYMSYEGKPVKASRLFAGQVYSDHLLSLAEHFHKKPEYTSAVLFDEALSMKVMKEPKAIPFDPQYLLTGDFFQTPLSDYPSFEVAYHHLLHDLVALQFESTSLVLNTDTKKLFVDGGFCRNGIFMNLLKMYFPSLEVYAANTPHASSLGAAMVIHESWNKEVMRKDIVEVTRI